ncbi:MAG TPA: hypothetical protein VMU84_17235, partial [Thermoanaerobaculia bacterium]|nr:hypothetical protein [Thermoanaerobaculia bacterium]
PLASVISESTTGQTYAVRWKAIAGAVGYEVQEANDASFTNPTSFSVTGTSRSFTKIANDPTAFFYRVRALSSCVTNTAFSPVIRVVVVPVPSPSSGPVSINLPDGSTTPVTFKIFVPSVPGGSTSFVATPDKPWLSVIPTSGIVPPEGILLTVSADPTGLPNGTWTGTILIVYGATVIGGRMETTATSTTTSVPVSINLVTPVTPVPLTTPATNALVIPSVGHIAGLASSWRSDIRLANISGLVENYMLTFNAGNGDPTLKQTEISVTPGTTTALDDIVRKWYGIGSLGESSGGLLTIQPLSESTALDVSKFTIVSSRTYNASATGTLGQFIPAIPLSGFLGHSAGATTTLLSLQQIAESSSQRTNLGLVEAFGKSASVTVSAFDGNGVRLLDLPVSLNGGQQLQLNSFLAQNGITLTNGRIEVRADGGEGLVTAYASVVDNFSQDPLLVSGIPLGDAGSDRYVVAGIAHVNTGSADWRSDLRVFNAALAPRNATLTFFPNGDPSASVSKTVAINPGEVKALDDVLSSTFGLSNVGGTLHVTTNQITPLIVTARTFNLTSNGTVGQFIPAITPNQAVASTTGALQILHVEESSRYRTNLGLAEVSGKPAMVEINVTLPDSKVSPSVQVPLDAYESIQLPIISGLGLGATYNARLSIRVIGGDGSVTAYGSVIDLLTKDPTYIPAQK